MGSVKAMKDEGLIGKRLKRQKEAIRRLEQKMRTKQLEFKKGEISQPDHSKKLKVMVAGGQRAEGRGQRSEGSRKFYGSLSPHPLF